MTTIHCAPSRPQGRRKRPVIRSRRPREGGSGSSVVGGAEPDVGDGHDGAISVDLRNLQGVLDIREYSCGRPGPPTATTEAGDERRALPEPRRIDDRWRD